jgi:hypothetical protein
MATCGEGAQTQAMGDGVSQGIFLCNLEVGRDSFCKFTVMEMVDGWRAMVAQFGRHLATVRVAYGEALDPRFAPAVAVQAGPPPPSNDLAQGCFSKMNR